MCPKKTLNPNSAACRVKEMKYGLHSVVLYKRPYFVDSFLLADPKYIFNTKTILRIFYLPDNADHQLRAHHPARSIHSGIQPQGMEKYAGH